MLTDSHRHTLTLWAIHEPRSCACEAASRAATAPQAARIVLHRLRTEAAPPLPPPPPTRAGRMAHS
eukprot:CAMPEP_0115882120 /NCGR_PEP_ID=MMETSP0287-20121206/28822_1 /TAXON_ID=412157 /ORGANISM="Chrysochromulina rotalis, Strain UIO044" /LENGTH=65 /DNA_ID=CAMNT_0003338151 /DNA_START=89 /DNA_END=286 /DNA_ORIENTATION=-